MRWYKMVSVQQIFGYSCRDKNKNKSGNNEDNSFDGDAARTHRLEMKLVLFKAAQVPVKMHAEI